MADSSMPKPSASVDGGEARDQNSAATAAQKPGDRIGGDDDAAGVDAGEPRGLGIAADGVEVAAEPGREQHELQDDEQRRA